MPMKEICSGVKDFGHFHKQTNKSHRQLNNRYKSRLLYCRHNRNQVVELFPQYSGKHIIKKRVKKDIITNIIILIASVLNISMNEINGELDKLFQPQTSVVKSIESKKTHDLGDLHRMIESLADKVKILEADAEKVKALQHKVGLLESDIVLLKRDNSRLKLLLETSPPLSSVLSPNNDDVPSINNPQVLQTRFSVFTHNSFSALSDECDSGSEEEVDPDKSDSHQDNLNTPSSINNQISNRLQNSDETTASFPTTPNNATTGTNQNKILPSTNNQPGKELQNSEEDIESISTTPNNTATVTNQDTQITSSSTNNQPSNRLRNNEENRKDKIAEISILNIPSKSSPPQPQLPNNASARVTAQIYIRIPGNPFEREIRNTLTNQGIPSEEVLIKELSRTPNWVSFAITISKGFEYVPYKLNQWPTGTSVQPFHGSKQWTQPGYSTKYPKLQSYQNKQQRANGTIPYTRDYRKRHDTNLSYRRPRTRDFSWSDGSYNPRHSPRHTNFGKARSYHGTYSNQRYTSNGRYRHQDPWANPRTHYNDEFPAESHSRNYNYDYGYHPNETW
ncbi:hypothetical protein SK128_000470 [Halocaridina rubra]|uniref:Uncharacterized protein n=1 Tax=Halocaridina rubra TaxID=373956 RepID=A0AAN8XKB8_HALRR